MDIGQPLIEHGAIDVRALREAVRSLPPAAWDRDRQSRAALAGDRPGDALFYYNDSPGFLPRGASADIIARRRVDVLRDGDCPLFDLVETILDDIRAVYRDCDVMRVQLAVLPAGDSISRHRDTNELALIHRLHVPVETNDGVVFEIGDGVFSLAVGTLYELNNAVPHAVRNDGVSDRIHLLVDMLPRTVGRVEYHDSRKAMAAARLADLHASGVAADG